MAREWQPASSFGLISHEAEELIGVGPARSQSISRNWSATRGAVLWEGAVDLAGSFPGFANWGSRAQSVLMTLTDRYLLVDEGKGHGFGLPIGWLSAAQALTGVEPITTETGDRLRVCYLDGNRVRGFSVRVRGGRFSSRSGRRANQFRAEAIALGLASTTPSTDLLLPPEHDLSLDWDDFASYEGEPVLWSGRATMPVGSGLESAVCDVWLTSESLIWGASSRAGIYRIATRSLAAITVAETPGYEPVIYWTISGRLQTHVDLPMVFVRPNRNDLEPATRESLVALLETHGHRIESPVSPIQPWRAIADTPAITEPAVPVDDGVTVPVPAIGLQQGPTQPGTSQSVRPVAASRRRLMDDGLFPERIPPTLPRSTPRPWGERVERVENDATPPGTPDDAATSPARSDPPVGQEEPVADRLRIWLPAVPRRPTPPPGRDATAMLVRRPRVRATTTEEFLASEQAARAATNEAGPDGCTIESPPEPRTSDVRPTLSDRGVIVRFRRPQTAVAKLVETVQRSADTVAARSTSSFAVGSVRSSDRPGDHLALKLRIAANAEKDLVPRPAEAEAGRIDEMHSTPFDLPNDEAEAPEATAPACGSVDIAQTSFAVRPSESGSTDQRTSGTTILPTPPTHLMIMRSAVSAIDTQLATAIRSVDRVANPRDRPEIAATAPFLSQALAELDAAVTLGELEPQAAETQRHAIIRSADTAERLRSLLDLHASGYLSETQLESRREFLLGRTSSTG